MSEHFRENSMHSIRNLVLNNDDDFLTNDIDNFEDSRIELRSTSHNLTSVLMNPRETMLENFLDDFATDQSTPLDVTILSPATPISASDNDQLKRMMLRLIKSHQHYNSLHQFNRGKPIQSERMRSTEDVAICFREVPVIFFDAKFSLINPSTFDSVMELADNELQDKLSQYLDYVEVALLKLIWSRSPSFFRALDDINGIQKKVSQATNQTLQLRRNLRAFDSGVAIISMKIPKLAKRRNNLLSVRNLMNAMQAVIQGKSTVESLLQIEDYLGALQVVNNTRQLIAQTLASVISLRGITQQLDEYESYIKEVMTSKFLSIAFEWADEDASSSSLRLPHSLSSSFSTANDRIDENSSLYKQTMNDSLLLPVGNNEEKISEFRNLIRIIYTFQKLKPAILSYKTKLSDNLRLIVRTCVTEYLTEFDPSLMTPDFRLGNEEALSVDAETPFAQRVKSMSDENFLACLSMCYENILLIAHRCKAVHEVIVEVVKKELEAKQSSVFPPVVDDDTTTKMEVHNESSRATTTPSTQAGDMVLTTTTTTMKEIDISISSSSSSSSSQQQIESQSSQEIGIEVGSSSSSSTLNNISNHENNLTNNNNGYSHPSSTSTTTSTNDTSWPTLNNSNHSTNSTTTNNDNNDTTVPSDDNNNNIDHSGSKVNYSNNSLSSITTSTTSTSNMNRESKKDKDNEKGFTSTTTTITVSTNSNVDIIISTSQTCISTSCELSQRLITQLLNLRRDNTARLSIDKIKFLWEISLFFVLSLERVATSTAYIMRQCLLSQAKVFLEHLTESFKSRLVNALDAERWVHSDVTLERQRELDRLTSGKAFLPVSRTSNGHASGSDSLDNFDASYHENNNGTNTTTTTSSHSNDITAANNHTDNTQHNGTNRKKKDPNPARVDSAQFKVVWSALLLVELLLSYLDISANFSPLTADVISKTAELLRLFDTRTKQLVLGAQAIHSAARLKSIAAKHLCLTAQSLGLILAILPHIRAALLAQLPSKHHMLLTEIDRISHSLIEHQGQIFTKFVSIVSDFVDASATKLTSVDWDRFQGQCEYFEDILRNVTALHRVLQSTLPASQTQDVFSRIFSLLNRKIILHFEDIMPSTQTGRQRILDEVVHLVNAFSMLKQVDASSVTLEDSFRVKFGR